MSCKKQTHVSVHIFGSSSVWLSCRPAAETWTCSDLTFTDWPSNDYDYDDEASCRRRSSLPVRYVWSGTSSELQHKHHPLPPSTELQLGAAPIQPTGRRANMHVCDYHRNSGKYLTFFFLHKNIQHLFFPLFLYSGANMQPAHQSVQETPLRSVILICEIYDCLEKINII